MKQKKFVFKAFKGPFQTIPSRLLEMKKLLPSGLKLKNGESAGVYFDDPSKVTSKELRWWIGFIVDNNVVDSEINAMIKPFESNGLRFVSIPAATAL